jgi:hypothetical protein
VEELLFGGFLKDQLLLRVLSWHRREMYVTHINVASKELYKLPVSIGLLLDEIFEFFRSGGEVLVKTFLPAIDEAGWETFTLLLEVLLRDGHEKGGIGIVSFSVDLYVSRGSRGHKKRRKEENCVAE